MLHWLSEKLFPGSGDGHTEHSPVSPEIGAAALLIEAAHRDGNYTEVERDLAVGAIMKLFNMSNADAVALLRAAEAAQKEAAYMMRFASAARELDADCKEQLITHIWAVIDSHNEHPIEEAFLVHRVVAVLGISQERARALRLPVTKRSD